MTPLEALRVALASELNVETEQSAQLVLDELEAQGYELAKRLLPSRPLEHGKLRVTLAAQLEPLGRYLNPASQADPLASTNLHDYTDQLATYFAKNLEKFADDRGGDVFLYVVVQQDGATAGKTYRSGHYVLDETREEGESDDADG